jgi:hypothetical protein
MYVCATTDNDASTMHDLSISNRKSGFDIIFAQNRNETALFFHAYTTLGSDIYWNIIIKM